MKLQLPHSRSLRKHLEQLFMALALLLPTALKAQLAPASSDATPVQASAPAPTPPVIKAGSDGLVLTPSEGTTLQIHGYLQADDRMFSANPKGASFDTFLFRRIRPLFEGTLFHELDYRFMPDFGQYNPQIQEAYVELTTIPWARLRVGKFKEPVGLEADKSDRDLALAERSLVSDLVPLRYMGAMVRGSFVSDSITYAFGYFNGSNDGSNGSFEWLPANEFAGRVFFLPFGRTKLVPLRNFGLGIGGSVAHQHSTVAGLKTVAQNTFFKYSSSTLANGQHNRISPQAYYYAGPVGLMAEYALSSADLVNKLSHANVNNQAWEITGSVMLTGEQNAYHRILPRRNFEPMRRWTHLGAVELVARYSNLRVGTNAFPLFANPTTAAQEAAERGFGVNWYLNRFVKLTTDLEQTDFTMASKSIPALRSEMVLMSRVQLDF